MLLQKKYYNIRRFKIDFQSKKIKLPNNIIVTQDLKTKLLK